MEINLENMQVSKHIVWSQMQLFTGNKMIVLHILKNTILVQLQHTCHVSRIFQESPSLSNNSQSHHFRVASPILHWVTMFYLFMFNWLGWVSCNLSFTFWSHHFSPGQPKKNLFFHWEAQSFNLLKHQKLMSASLMSHFQ